MAKYVGPIVDVDVHHAWFDREEIIKYMPKRWQDYMRTANIEVDPVYHHPTISNNGAWLLDSLDPELSFGTDEAKLRGMLLDRYNYHACMLTHNVGACGGHVNPELAVAICRAVNDWNIDCWLTRDKRFHSVVVIPSGQPEAAAAEIRRVGKHPRILGVLFAGNMLRRP